MFQEFFYQQMNGCRRVVTCGIARLVLREQATRIGDGCLLPAFQFLIQRIAVFLVRMPQCLPYKIPGMLFSPQLEMQSQEPAT